MTASSGDPIHGNDNAYTQTYDEANTFTNARQTIAAGNDGEWDFALVNNSAPASTTYCFRAALSNGTDLDTYSQYPEITTGIPPAFAQSAYQWFQNVNATSVGPVIAGGSGNYVTSWYNSSWGYRTKITLNSLFSSRSARPLSGTRVLRAGIWAPRPRTISCSPHPTGRRS